MRKTAGADAAYEIYYSTDTEASWNVSDSYPFLTIEAAAKAAGADGLIRRLPNGYDTILGEGVSVLSQGERQLITIARAMLADAPILDEAASSVDTVTERKYAAQCLQ